MGLPSEHWGLCLVLYLKMSWQVFSAPADLECLKKVFLGSSPRAIQTQQSAGLTGSTFTEH